MTRFALAGLAAAFIMAVPTMAQDAPATPTMQDDLDCALFTAMVLGDIEEGTDPEAETGILGAMTYFVGRWEGAGGTDLKQAMLDRVETLTELEMASLGDKCANRMDELGDKLTAAGDAMIALAEKEEAAGQ